MNVFEIPGKDCFSSLIDICYNVPTIILAINSIATTHVVTGSSFNFPEQSLQITYERIPNMIPSDMLDAHTIKIAVRKAGMPSDISLKSISVIGVIIITPTIISAGAVPALGMEPKRGSRKSEITKRTATLCNTCCTFYESGDGGGSEHCSCGCSYSVSEKGFLGIGDGSVFLDESGLSCASDKGSNCIEHIYKQECKYDYNKVEDGSAA